MFKKMKEDIPNGKYDELLKFIKPLTEEEYKWDWFDNTPHLANPKEASERERQYATFEGPVLTFIHALEHLQTFEESHEILKGKEKLLHDLSISKIPLKKFTAEELTAILNLTVEKEIPDKGTVKFNAINGGYLAILEEIRRRIG